jgi:hypothetical protein
MENEERSQPEAQYQRELEGVRNDFITCCKLIIGFQNYAILNNLTPNFVFLLQLNPSMISNLAICFKIIIEIQIYFTLSQIKSN